MLRIRIAHSTTDFGLFPSGTTGSDVDVSAVVESVMVFGIDVFAMGGSAKASACLCHVIIMLEIEHTCLLKQVGY